MPVSLGPTPVRAALASNCVQSVAGADPAPATPWASRLGARLKPESAVPPQASAGDRSQRARDRRAAHRPGPGLAAAPARVSGHARRRRRTMAAALTALRPGLSATPAAATAVAVATAAALAALTGAPARP